MRVGAVDGVDTVDFKTHAVLADTVGSAGLAAFPEESVLYEKGKLIR